MMDQHNPQLDPLSDAFATVVARKVIAELRSELVKEQEPRPPDKKHCTVPEAAVMLGRSIQWIRERKREFGGRKVGKYLVLSTEAIENYISTTRPGMRRDER